MVKINLIAETTGEDLGVIKIKNKDFKMLSDEAQRKNITLEAHLINILRDFAKHEKV